MQVVQGDSLQNIELVPQSNKGFVFRIGEEKNPFFLVVFLRAGSVSRSDRAVSFNERDIRNPTPGLQKNLIKFTYLCYDDGKKKQCSHTPADLDSDDRGTAWTPKNPIQRVDLAEWKISPSSKDLVSILQKSDLYATKAVPSTTPVKRLAAPTDSGLTLKIKYQQPKVSRSDFQDFAGRGFDEVVFQLAAQSRIKAASAHAFAESLANAKGVKTKKGKPIRAVAWVNLIEDNNQLFVVSAFNQLISNPSQLMVCTGRDSPRPKACVDDAATRKKLINHYRQLFTDLKAELSRRGVADLLNGVALDFELPQDCRCGAFTVEQRKKNVHELYSGLADAIRSQFGETVRIYNNGAEIRADCKSSLLGIDYKAFYADLGMIPAPDPVELRGDFGKKLLSNMQTCFKSMGISTADFEYPLVVNPVQAGRSTRECQSSDDVKQSYEFAKSSGAFSSLTLFEYSIWQGICRTTCVAFLTPPCSLPLRKAS